MAWRDRPGRSHFSPGRGSVGIEWGAGKDGTPYRQPGRRQGRARSGLLALAIRIGLIEFLDAEMLQFVAWVAALLPLLAIDIWAYYCSAIRKREPDWRGTAAAVIAAMALNAFVIRSLYNLGDADNLAYAAAIIITGLGISWLANRSAEGMLRQREATVPARGERNSLKPALSVGIAFAFFAFIFVFITTASPPV